MADPATRGVGGGRNEPARPLPRGSALSGPTRFPAFVRGSVGSSHCGPSHPKTPRRGVAVQDPASVQGRAGRRRGCHARYGPDRSVALRASIARRVTGDAVGCTARHGSHSRTTPDPRRFLDRSWTRAVAGGRDESLVTGVGNAGRGIRRPSGRVRVDRQCHPSRCDVRGTGSRSLGSERR